ncbi:MULTISPECIES: hypothetical protein [unclassified Oceanobacter]|uniref:hypothetical protein n=1 Tax=unclassified Oceanobacter TaxID=2620260 RepID=UPI0027373F93|nr:MULTISPECIES: hypothetical protein [unclassified Oceanobacter]MDP2610049.1 hypothetical protein [Oceanobacter sp. 1_MG-2023]MDP2613315.1 hypothetical protein [Oceanobacter sp. 2_MG-2023]
MTGYTSLSATARKLGVTPHKLKMLLADDLAINQGRDKIWRPTGRAQNLILPLYQSVETGTGTRETLTLMVTERGYRYCERLLANRKRAA